MPKQILFNTKLFQLHIYIQSAPLLMSSSNTNGNEYLGKFLDHLWRCAAFDSEFHINISFNQYAAIRGREPEALLNMFPYQQLIDWLCAPLSFDYDGEKATKQIHIWDGSRTDNEMYRSNVCANTSGQQFTRAENCFLKNKYKCVLNELLELLITVNHLQLEFFPIFFSRNLNCQNNELHNSP